MSPTITIVLIILVLVVLAAVFLGVRAGRRKKLQSTFGPEYDRVVADTGSRSEAEKELRERERRHAELELKELTPESQARYAASWEEVQIEFVDNPSAAVHKADDLVTSLMAERGYPTGELDERIATLSVEHANTLQHYRDAHAISERSRDGSADTEDLRVALVHYRVLFADLLGTDPVPTNAANTTSASTTAPSTDSGTTETGSGTEVADARSTDATDSPHASTDAHTSSTESRINDDKPAPAPRTAADDSTDAAPDKTR
jgi:hypothetical protein